MKKSYLLLYCTSQRRVRGYTKNRTEQQELHFLSFELLLYYTQRIDAITFFKLNNCMSFFTLSLYCFIIFSCHLNYYYIKYTQRIDDAIIFLN